MASADPSPARHRPEQSDQEWNGTGSDPADLETRVTLDLTRKFQRIPLVTSSDVAWEETRVVLDAWSGTQVTARWQPLSGEVTRNRALHVLFEQTPQVRLHISLESWQGQATIRVAPQLQLPNGQVTDWVLSRGTKLHRKALQRVTLLQTRIHETEREQRQILAWFETRSTKRIADRAAAKARLGSMREEVPQLAASWMRAQREADALSEIVTLGQQLHGLAELTFSIHNVTRFAAMPE